jgi:hypothetical protein
MKSVNPSTRVRQFEHLKGRELYDAIEDLPPWQQIQELFPWFTPFDVLIFYLFDEEGFQISGILDPNPDDLKRIQDVLPLLGYPPKFFLESTIRHRRSKALQLLATVLELIERHTPRTPLPPSGLLEVTIPVPGPIGRTYTVINEA